MAAFNGGIIPIYDGEDSQCYNYTLPYAFQTVPEIAIAVSDFESDPSRNIFFFIKPVRSDSLVGVPFVIRTQWAYTSWVHIGFSFLAEDRADVETGYYQVDSGSLAGCEVGKQIQVLLPFRNQFDQNRQIFFHLFLHGFEITTVLATQGSRSPYEIQITSSSADRRGITVVLSTTTTTQVNSIYISYIAHHAIQILEVASGSHLFDAQAGGVFFNTPTSLIPRSYARIYGITGFIINYNAQQLVFSTKWDGFSFSFVFGGGSKFVQYFTFNYIFFIGSECSGCPGYPLTSNGTCVSFCPAGTSQTPENVCINCGVGRIWNGTTCVLDCPAGQYLNTETNLCECPPSMNWNGAACITCSNGKVWTPSVKSCECPQPLRWNGYTCAKLPECDGGRIWDVYSFTCVCPDYQYLKGNRCVDIPICTGGKVLSNYQCVCPENYVQDPRGYCVYTPCFGGQIWTGTSCVCPAGLHFNTTMCIECINGQAWNPITLTCACNSGYKWNGQYCERTYECTGNRVWNTTYEQCVCAANFYWSGYACLPIPVCTGNQYWDQTIQKCACYAGFKFNGTACVSCSNGKVWNQTSLTCSCPPGTIENQGQCNIQQQCTGGRVWIQNLWSCQCPASTVWNGNFCILNPCSNGRDWNADAKSCVCPPNRVYINETCVPPQISCTNGRVWNPAIYACECPAGTYPRYTSCEPIPACYNGQVYNPLNNQCNCPFGLVLKAGVCADPNCQTGRYWNGYECTIISCPPPSFFSIDRCVYKGDNKCPFGYIWNGHKCIFYPTSCPPGTSWTGTACQPTGNCGNGTYLNGGSCAVLPSQCPPGTSFNGIMCVGPNNLCPNGTYNSNNGNRCLPYVPCTNGFVWDSNYLRCVCPAGQINNGNNCVQCPLQKTWDPVSGCICPDGTFDAGASCETVNQNRCSVIPNAIWNTDKCVCRPGFTKVAFQCVCYGTQNGNLCDKCSYKPNSVLNPATDICECQTGFTQINGFCVPAGSNIGTGDPGKCMVGTYFDVAHRQCLACPDGCLTCSDCYTCRVCQPEFIFDPRTSVCYEKCGDGKKFVLGCDDGNNNDGDGCSRDCRVEAGYTCAGGTPENPDLCSNAIPNTISIIQTGQVRLSTSIVLNLRVSYIPNSLLIATECKDSCSQILVGTVTSGDSSTLGITSKYLAGTAYDFTLTIEFGRPYIGQFTIKVDINRNSVGKYFGAIPINPITIVVNPTYLAAVEQSK